MTNKNKDFYLTKDGLSRLKDELQELKKVKRPKLVKRVSEARSKGDLSENADYTSAREELSMLDGRIEELGEILSRSKLIKKNQDDCPQKVGLGCQVTVETNGKTHIYDVVGEWEADPMKKKISHNSPLGKGLIGKRIGDAIEVEAPAGKIVYKIKKIK